MNDDTLTVLFEKKSLEVKNPSLTAIDDYDVDGTLNGIKSGLEIMKKDIDETIISDSSFVKSSSNLDTVRLNQSNTSKEAPIVSNFIHTISKNVIDYFDEEYVNPEEYDGVVNAVYKDYFSATLRQRNTDRLIEMNIMFDELKYKSDIELVSVGSNFFVVVGKKSRPFLSKKRKFERGTQTKIFDVFFRMEKKLSKKEMKQADELATRWIEFFNS